MENNNNNKDEDVPEEEEDEMVDLEGYERGKQRLLEEKEQICRETEAGSKAREAALTKNRSRLHRLKVKHTPRLKEKERVRDQKRNQRVRE